MRPLFILLLAVHPVIASASQHRMLPTEELRQQISVLATGNPSDAAIRNSERAVTKFITKQIESAPDIAACELETQLQKVVEATMPDACRTRYRDVRNTPGVFVQDWQPGTTRREFVITYTAFGLPPSHTIVETYIWGNGRVRRTALNRDALKNFNAGSEEIAFHIDSGEYWILAWGTAINASGCALPGQAVLYQAGVNAIKVVWQTPV